MSNSMSVGASHTSNRSQSNQLIVAVQEFSCLMAISALVGRVVGIGALPAMTNWFITTELVPQIPKISFFGLNIYTNNEANLLAKRSITIILFISSGFSPVSALALSGITIFTNIIFNALKNSYSDFRFCHSGDRTQKFEKLNPKSWGFIQTAGSACLAYGLASAVSLNPMASAACVIALRIHNYVASRYHSKENSRRVVYDLLMVSFLGTVALTATGFSTVSGPAIFAFLGIDSLACNILNLGRNTYFEKVLKYKKS
jgi:hypothetical protein